MNVALMEKTAHDESLSLDERRKAHQDVAAALEQAAEMAMALGAPEIYRGLEDVADSLRGTAPAEKDNF